jgi:3-hydroxyisobutyrate dehydrogenase
MGMPISAVLAKAGYEVAATDKRTAAREDAVRCGALWRDSPADAAESTDVLITVLPGPEQVRAAMTGPAGALPALAPGATWIDMTSNVPQAVEPVRDRAIGQGVLVLEAPAGGGPAAARQGQLQLFIGGDAHVLDCNRPILEVLADSERIIHVGGYGTGYTAKLLVNLLWFGQAIATAEALLIGQAAGIDLRVLQQALGSSPAATAFITGDLDRLLRGDYLTTFGLDGIYDELEAVTALAREHQLPSPLSDLVLQTYRRALDRYGAVPGELMGVALLEEEAARRLRAEGD